MKKRFSDQQMAFALKQAGTGIIVAEVGTAVTTSRDHLPSFLRQSGSDRKEVHADA